MELTFESQNCKIKNSPNYSDFTICHQIVSLDTSPPMASDKYDPLITMTAYGCWSTIQEVHSHNNLTLKRRLRSALFHIKLGPFGQCVEDILESNSGLRMYWDSHDLLLQQQGPYLWRVNHHTRFAWSCLFNLTRWRKAWHWPESAALMCFMFCIHHCHRAGEDCRCHGRTGERGCVCVCAQWREALWKGDMCVQVKGECLNS